MGKRMLIDASHPEETRVVVLSGNRLEEFDYESAARTQLKGNIYLAKVTRVEPSLQAAFVEYGGNRHGFLPFSEIHPDYYRIPIADREALIAEEARLSRDSQGDDPEDGTEPDETDDPTAEAPGPDGEAPETSDSGSGEPEPPETAAAGRDGKVEEVEVETRVDTVGGDEVEEDARKRARFLRRYKIQEVIKRRQVMLVQVSKEERGNKGAALTTYLSLAGRYCVLMPNTGRGGGISRKIGNASDRRRLKKVMSELEIPEGMAVIVRTAGSERSKVEIRRDYEYLMRLWNEIREKTLQSTAPALIHEEANLIKRAIRDLYSRDMDDIVVDGEDGYKTAKGFMKNLMPSHARNVKLHKDSEVPLFYRQKVEGQLDAMHSASVQLKSGGYIVINPTEALVAIDVNSGKATRERHIEETALKTNIEAAEEVARQLRLRDLAGLIVIDFIDMEEHRHNREVERRFKDAMRHDRARIQLGRISPFGLLEMSRQRLRPSLFETSTMSCGQCGGVGYIRSTDSTALHVLRVLEEEGIRRGGGEVSIALPPAVALYVLNAKRARLNDLEQRYSLRVQVDQDESLIAPDLKLDRLSSSGPGPQFEAEDAEAPAEDGEGRKRRGRRRRRRKDDAETAGEAAAASGEIAADDEAAEAEAPALAAADDDEGEEQRRPRRRRGKRGGRRRSKRRRDAAEVETEESPPSAPLAADGEADSLAEAPPPDSEPAPADAPEAVEAAADPDAETAAERPKRPRRRARKKPAAASAAEADAVETEAPSEAEPSDPGETVPDEKPKRRRARTTRTSESGRRTRRKADSAAEAPPETAVDGEAVTPPMVAADINAQGPRDEPRRPEADATSEPGPSNPAPLDQSAGAEAGDQPGQPKRRGWWQRWV